MVGKDVGSLQKAQALRSRYCQLLVDNALPGVPWWLSGLRIWHCHCCGAALIPGSGTSHVVGAFTPPQKKSAS